MTVYEPRFSSDSQEQDPLVQINHVASKDLYNVYEAQVFAGGTLRGIGMGRPYIQVDEEGNYAIQRGLVASIDVLAAHPETEEVARTSFSNVLDLITTQNQAGIALGFVGVSRLIEQLDAVGKTAAISATEFVTDVSLSVIAVDSDVRTAAYKSGGMWLPENVTDRDQVTYIGPSVRGTDKNVSVPLLLHEDGRIRTTALERVDYVQVGEVIFQRRIQEATMPRPATEIYERSDWWIRATNQTFSLRVRTGSRLVDETVHTAHAESNVRHLSYLRDTE